MNASDSIYAELISTVVHSKNFRTIFYFAPEDETERCHMAKWMSFTEETIPWLTWNSIKSFKLGDLLSSLYSNTRLSSTSLSSGLAHKDFRFFTIYTTCQGASGAILRSGC